jgi:uncharacterized membrane protein
MKKESRLRSIAKSIIWRLLGVLVLAIVTYAFTRSLIQTGLITFIHHFAFIFIYYFHERAWLKVNWSEKRKKWVRPFTYEIILGHLVLGLITLAVTGSWLNVSLITITYIENKLWIYAAYDWVWNKRIKWGIT